MKVKIKRLNSNAHVPKYAKFGDAAVDLVATSYNYTEGMNFTYGTGLSIEIPEGYVGLIYPRSSISNTSLYLRNSVGVIDSGYRGEIMLKFGTDVDYYMEEGLPHYWGDYSERKEGDLLDIYKIDDKIGQLMIVPYPQIEFIESEELSETSRGEGGFGSTGK